MSIPELRLRLRLRQALACLGRSGRPWSRRSSPRLSGWLSGEEAVRRSDPELMVSPAAEKVPEDGLTESTDPVAAK